MEGSAGAVVHKSAHPNLPPAKAEQVVQYLLARNYHLTALELLVESQAAGHDAEFPELQLFFTNPERFPAEEVAKYAQANALDQQARAQEREQKLQLLEYELRVAKEDLANLGRRVSAQGSQPNTPTSQVQRQTSAKALSPRLSRMGGGPDAVAEASRHPVVLHPPDTGVLQPGGDAAVEDNSGLGGGSLQNLAGRLQPQESTALEDLDWSKLGDPTEMDQQVVLSAMMAYCLHMRLRTTAITLQEEAANLLPGVTLPSNAYLAASGAGSAGMPQDGLMLWRWYKLARSTLAQQGADALSSQAAAELQLQSQVEALGRQVEQLRVALAKSDEEYAAARTATSAAKAQVATLQKQLEDVRAGRSAAPHLGLLATSSIDLSATGRSAASSKGGGVPQGLDGSGEEPGGLHMHSAIVGQLTELLPRIMPNLTIKTRLEILPMVQAVILAARDPETQRILTGLVFNGVATPDPLQRGAVVALCAGVAAHLGPAWAAQELLATCAKQVASPSAERRVLVAEMITALLDPGSGQPFLAGPLPSTPSTSGVPPSPSPNHSAAAGGGSGQRAAAAAQPRGAYGGGMGQLQGPLVDCAAQAHTLLPALQKLAEDRMEQVREAAVKAIVALLQPAGLPFSRANYAAMEELVLPLVMDTEPVSSAALTTLVPVLQTWCAPSDLISTTLLPRVVADISRLSRDAAALPSISGGSGSLAPGMAAANAGAYTGQAMAGGSGHLQPPPLGPSMSVGGTSVLPGQSAASMTGMQRSSASSTGRMFPGMGGQAYNTRRFACWEHQAMHQLLELYTLLLPALKASALQAVPAGVVAAAAAAMESKQPQGNGHAGVDTDKPPSLQLPPAASLGAQRMSSSIAAVGTSTPVAGPEEGQPQQQGSAFAEATAQAAVDGPAQGDPIDAGPGQQQQGTDKATGAATDREMEDKGGASSDGPLQYPLNRHLSSSGDGSSVRTTVVHHEVSAGAGDFLGPSKLSQLLLSASRSGPDGSTGQVLNVQELVAAGELDAAALFGAWAASDKGTQWKRMQWVLQLLVPELLELTKALGQPQTPASSGAGVGAAPSQHQAGGAAGYSMDGGPGAYGGVAPVSAAASSWVLHLQLARAVALTATTFGVGWTHGALLPMYCTAAGCSTPSLYQPQAGSGVLEAAEQLAPQTQAGAYTARSCILPHLLAAVLPYTPAPCMADWATRLTQVSVDIPASAQLQLPPFFGVLQPPRVPQPQAVQAAQQHLSAAVHFACAANPSITPRILEVLDGLVQRKSWSGHLPAGMPPPSPAPMTGLTGAVALALARGLLPLMARDTHPPKSTVSDDSPHAPQAQAAPTMPSLPGTPLDASTPAGGSHPDLTQLDGEGLLLEPVGLPPLSGFNGHGQGAGAGLGQQPVSKKVMALLMVMLSKGDTEVQCGVVVVLVEVLLRCTGALGPARPEDAKLVEQVCVVYDSLLAGSAPHLASTVLTAMQQVASAVTPLTPRSPTAAQLIEWVLGAVHAMSTQLLPPAPHPATGATPQYPTDHQRHVACQLLGITTAVFVHDNRLPRLQPGIQACIDALVKVRHLLPEPYAAVLTPMQANNRGAAATAMQNAKAAAAALSVVAAPQAQAGWGSAVLLQPPAAGTQTVGGGGAVQQQYNLSQQQQQYLQQQAGQASKQQLQQQQYQAAGLGQMTAQQHFASSAHLQPQQAPAQALGLGDRLQQFKNRFRKKSVTDGELQEGPPPA